VQKVIASLQEKVTAQAAQSHLTSPMDSSDGLMSVTWQAILEISMTGTLASRPIPHNDHPAPARPPSLPQNAVKVQFQGLVWVILYKIFELWFTVPFCASPSLQPQPNYPSVHPFSQHMANITGHHNLYRWLLDFQQLFQNMAWDWWRYQNGIPE